jgi:hypothetical protein
MTSPCPKLIMDERVKLVPVIVDEEVQSSYSTITLMADGSAPGAAKSSPWKPRSGPPRR